MNCQEFQRVLPQIIESGGSEAEQAHLRGCQACSELVRDLKYIAEQAKLLLPMHDPNPRVWNNIQDSLAREGLIPDDRKAGPKKKSWTPLGLALAILAVLSLALVLVNYHPSAPAAQETMAPGAATTGSPAPDQAQPNH